MLSVSIEDYIKAIYALEIDDGKASTKAISERLGVKMASVTGMLKHLASEGYLRHTPYHGVKMTDKGRRVAVKMIRRHRLIEQFLHKTLGLSWDEVDADAEVLEHATSDRLIERIYEYLGCPEFDPHGSPIPKHDGDLPWRRGVPLSEFEQGQRGTVVEVWDGDPEFLRYLTKLKLAIGSKIRVRELAPFGGPITLDIGSRSVSIGIEAARRIRVDAGKTEGRSKKKVTK